MIVTDDRVARFVGERCATVIYPPFTALGIERGGEVIAGVVFNCYTINDVHVTVAGHGFTKGFIKTVGMYVFAGMGCLRMTITTEQQKICDIATRMGARIEGRLRNHFGPGRDAVMLGILREDWKF